MHQRNPKKTKVSLPKVIQDYTLPTICKDERLQDGNNYLPTFKSVVVMAEGAISLDSLDLDKSLGLPESSINESRLLGLNDGANPVTEVKPAECAPITPFDLGL